MQRRSIGVAVRRLAILLGAGMAVVSHASVTPAPDRAEGDGPYSQLILRGHTDALKWRPGVTANNWSLSSGRAEATRQALLRGGIAESRFARIEGVAAREPLIAGDPADPRNRRISVLVLD